MAYVVRRPRGRFEIRESVHTPSGPRARTLANFSLLTEAVLGAAAARAQRPFDVARVRASAARCGAPTERGPGAGPAGVPKQAQEQYRGFVEASGRMARSLAPSSAGRRDPGEALIDLLGFAEQVARSQAPRPSEPLSFPPLAGIVERRAARGSAPES